MADTVGVPTAIAEGIEAEIVRGPLGVLLGMELVRLETGCAAVCMPYRLELTTAGDTVHGGAIAALVDTAGTAAAWAFPDANPDDRGATVGFSVQFLSAARSATLTATARVRRRGREITTIDVSVRSDDETEVAAALLTYKVSPRTR